MEVWLVIDGETQSQWYARVLDKGTVSGAPWGRAFFYRWDQLGRPEA